MYANRFETGSAVPRAVDPDAVVGRRRRDAVR
jgi:hypothetical protein